MRNIAAALSLLALAACAGMPESEGPPTAFRLTSRGIFSKYRPIDRFPARRYSRRWGKRWFQIPIPYRK